MTYKEAESLIIDAYFKDEIQPYDGRFCFCGTLNNNKKGWQWYGNEHYSNSEMMQMEHALLTTIDNLSLRSGDKFQQGRCRELIFIHPNYENALFEGMMEALNVLRDIHKSKGENVDEEVVFKKRVLVKNF